MPGLLDYIPSQSDVQRTLADLLSGSRNRLADLMPRGLLGAAKQYISDAAPGGALNREWTPENVRTAGEVASMMPNPAGDVISGLLAVDDLRKGDYGSAALNSLGLVPFVPALGGIIKPGMDWASKKPPDIRKLAKNKDKFLYHSSDPQNLDSLHYGIEPTNSGPWVTEVAHGTGADDVSELLERSTPLSWFSDEPKWVNAFVSRITGKPVSQITKDDIAQHGHLAIINKKAADTKNIYKIGNEGLSQGEYSIVQNLRGQKMKAYETPIYGETHYGNRLEPFGVERNEYVGTDTVAPMVQLTGDDLVQFLRFSGLLK